MVLVHYNQIEYTACYLNVSNVYVTNVLANVNCEKCKGSKAFKEKINK